MRTKITDNIDNSTDTLNNTTPNNSKVPEQNSNNNIQNQIPEGTLLKPPKAKRFEPYLPTDKRKRVSQSIAGRYQQKIIGHEDGTMPDLFRLRKEKELTIYQVGDMIGVTPKQVNEYEDHPETRIEMKLETAVRLCEVLGINNPEDLLIIE